MQQQCGKRQQRQRAAHHLRPLAPAFDQRRHRGVFESRLREPLPHGLLGGRISGGRGGFGENAQVRGFALHVPVVTGEPQRGLRIAVQLQLEARLLAPVHDVAARPAGVETRAQA